MRLLMVLTVFFFAGFFTHAFFFPSSFLDLNPQAYLPLAEEKKEEKVAVVEKNTFITRVSYDGSFSPPVVSIKKSYYLSVVNINKNSLMVLKSQTPYLNTPRGFGEGEELRVRMDEDGTFQITDGNGEYLKITVK